MKNEKGIFYFVFGLSILVFLLVILLNERVLGPPETFPAFIYKLPLLNASINGTVSILLILSYGFIRRGHVQEHKKLNLTSFVLSAIFLISYVTYHFFAKHTIYGGEGIVALVYKSILVSHIILAAVVLPLVLLSFYYGLKNNIKKHKKLVRFAYPIWLYVAITGVVIYLMISPYYQHS